jgi:hypothetical protein
MATYRSTSGVKWDNVFRAVTPSVHLLTDKVHDRARRNLARHVRTGALIRSLYARKALLSGRVFIGTDHWRFIEYGTSPHIIEPNRKQALNWPTARHPVRRVRHPGTSEYAPMRRAIRAQRGVRTGGV